MSDATREALGGDGNPTTSRSPDNTAEKSSSEEAQQDGSKTSTEQSEKTATGETTTDDTKSTTEGDDTGDTKADVDTVPSDKDVEAKIRSELNLGDDEATTKAEWKRRYAGSSRENRRMVQQKGAVDTALAKLGMKQVMSQTDDGEVVEFVADKAWVASKSDGQAEAAYKTLSPQELQAAQEDIAGLHRKTHLESYKKGVESVARQLVPTARADMIELPQEVLNSLRNDIANAKNSKGELLHPDFALLEPYMGELVESDDMPEVLVDLMGSDPDAYKFLLGLLARAVHDTAGPLLAEQRSAKKKVETKKKRTREDVSLTSEGAQTRRSKSASTPEDEAAEIAHAKPVW